MRNSQKPADGPKESDVKLWHIAYTFMAIGLASFSLASLGEARKWMTIKRKWFTDDEYMQGLGLVQLLPGATTVNLLSYLGFRLRGLPGALIATIFFLLPCFLLMLFLSHLYLRYGNIPSISGLFRGLGALVVGLVLNTILNLWQAGVKTPFNRLMAMASFAMVYWLHTGIMYILLTACGTSMIMVFLVSRFPVLSRWMLHKNGADGNGPCPQSSPATHSQNRRKIVMLGFWLILILCADFALIHLQPEVMRMAISLLQIGAVTFGSGYAMLPFIQNAVVNQFGWLTNQEFTVALALSLITPGPVTIISTFIGYKVAGIFGALAGTFNMYYPAWALTTLIATPYASIGKIGTVKQVIDGIVAAFIGTLFVVLIKISMDNLVDVPATAMAAAAFVTQRFAEIDTVWIVVCGALVSLVLFN